MDINFTPSMTSKELADFVTNVMTLSNGAHTQIAEFMTPQSMAVRARFVERCASLASAVAETMTASS